MPISISASMRNRSSRSVYEDEADAVQPDDGIFSPKPNASAMANGAATNAGTPAVSGTPRFGSGARFDRGKCYEGKENSAAMRGQFGPGMYEVRCSKMGSPLWKGRGSTAAQTWK